MTIIYDELHWQSKKVGYSQVEWVSDTYFDKILKLDLDEDINLNTGFKNSTNSPNKTPLSTIPVNITRETHHIREGFRLVREQTYTSVPLRYQPFENDYIGICFVFAPNSINHKDLAFKEIYHKDLNITNGYQFDAETIYATNKQLHYVSLQFDSHFIESLNEQQPIPKWLLRLVYNQPKKILERISVSPVLRHLAWQICQIPTTSQLSDSLRIESKAVEWLANIIEGNANTNLANHSASNDELANRAKNLVIQACTIIHAEYFQPLTISELALRVGTNTSYLKQYFKQYIGLSIHQYLTKYRLKQSKYLLLQNPKLEIRVIAEMCGYQAGHFSQLFKSEYGLSPIEYRQKCVVEL